MTNEEAKVFLDNLKICIDEHPVVADWLVEIADRKDEPQNYCDDCLYTDTCDSKEFFYACTSKATISKMEQVEDETRLPANCLNCANGGSYKCSKCDGEMYYKYDNAEPQTERSE